MSVKKELLLPAMLLLSSSSQAFDWFLDPSLTFTERYTDNLRLLVKPTRDNLISTFSPSLNFGYLTDENELTGNFLWNQSVYHGEDSLNFGEKILNLNDSFTADRWSLNTTGRYAIESTITTQTDVNSGGYVAAQLPRDTKSISPNLTYKLTETNSLQLGLSYLDVTFEKHPNLAFTDYSNGQLYSTLNHNYSNKLSFNLTGSYSLYYAGTSAPLLLYYNNNLAHPYLENYKQNSTTSSYQLGVQYLFDEHTTFSATAGLRDTSSTTNYQCSMFVPGCSFFATHLSSTTNGKIYSVSVKRNFERGNLNLSANQQLNPASTGSQQQSTSLNGSGLYHLDERWSLGITGLYQIVETIAASNSSTIFNYNRTYKSISPNIQWKWTPEVNLQLSYTYSDQYFTSSNLTALANNVQLQFIYQPSINRQVK